MEAYIKHRYLVNFSAIPSGMKEMCLRLPAYWKVQRGPAENINLSSNSPADFRWILSGILILSTIEVSSNEKIESFILFLICF